MEPGLNSPRGMGHFEWETLAKVLDPGVPLECVREHQNELERTRGVLWTTKSNLNLNRIELN